MGGQECGELGCLVCWCVLVQKEETSTSFVPRSGVVSTLLGGEHPMRWSHHPGLALPSLALHCVAQILVLAYVNTCSHR